VLAVWIQNQKKKSMTLGKWSKDGWREETKQACPSLPGPACWHELAELDKRMPHERPRQLAHPSSSSFHTSPAPNTNSTFHTKWVTGAVARRRGTGGGACTQTTQPQLPRTELTRQTLSLGAISWHGHLARNHSTCDGWSIFPRLEGTKRSCQYDTQRAVYARAPLQVRHGGRTEQHVLRHKFEQTSRSLDF
jgi:hypothetical protein